MIAGPPGVYICNECIEICNSILQEEQRRTPEGAQAGPAVGARTGAMPRRGVTGTPGAAMSSSASAIPDARNPW